MNSIVLAGKVIDIDLKNNTFTLSVERNYRDDEGQYQYDTFLCQPWKGMNNYLSSYLNQNDYLIIKGQIKNDNDKNVVMVDQFSIMYRPNKKINT